jgi:hypothetical protein
MRDVALYKRVVDGLVEECQSGQGQIGPRRARAGVWNHAATADMPMENQWHLNQLLAPLNDEQRGAR